MGVIYKITNIINKKIYIGQTIRPEPERWQQHVWNAINNKDNQDCPYLCKAIRKYGKENFIREILEEIPNDQLNKREIFWIDFFNSTNKDIGYNLSKGGNGHTLYNDDEIIDAYLKNNEKIKQAAYFLGCDRNILSKRLQALGFKTNNNVKITFYNIKKQKIKTFDTLQEAAKEINCKVSVFFRKSHYINGIFFIREDEELTIEEIINNLNPQLKDFQAIEQYDFYGNYITTFENAEKASKQTNINLSSIKQASSLNGNQKTAGGFLWRRKYGELSYKEMLNRFLLSPSCSEVDEIDSLGNIIKTYQSSAFIEKENNWSRNVVKKVCDGKQKSTHGRFFQYHNPLKRELINGRI